MKNNWYKPLFFLIFTCSLFTFIGPYNPKPGNSQSLLVVNASLTDEDGSNYVRLSCTIKTVDDKPEMGSEVKQKRKYITGNDIVDLNLPLFRLYIAGEPYKTEFLD
jgi:hypothetical protein